MLSKEMREAALASLDLSVRSSNCLKNENIHTVGEFVDKSLAELRRIPNFGRTSLFEVQGKIVELALGMQLAAPTKSKGPKSSQGAIAAAEKRGFERAQAQYAARLDRANRALRSLSTDKWKLETDQKALADERAAFEKERQDFQSHKIRMRDERNQYVRCLCSSADLPDGRKVWEGDIFLVEPGLAASLLASPNFAPAEIPVPAFG